MAVQLQFCVRHWMENVIHPHTSILKRGLRVSLVLMLGLSSQGYASEPLAQQYLRDSRQLEQQHQFYDSARYAYAAAQEDPSVQSQAYAQMALGLIQAGLPHAGSYFFLRTLQVGDSTAIRAVLTQTQNLLEVVGPDLLRKYLIRHTQYADYDLENRSAYLYALAKDALLNQDPGRAVQYVDGMTQNSLSWPFALFLRGAAHSILGKNEEALRDFQNCVLSSSRVSQKSLRYDLRDRCLAGRARTFYQMEQFEQADLAYGQVQKRSNLWPDLLFEQAWNSFAREEYNRALGKLVSYKSPALSFVFNPEIDVLRAQSFLALCLYSDVNQGVNEFNARYAQVGEQVKAFVEKNADHLNVFYEFGKSALRAPLSTQNQMHQFSFRFIRSPYFQNLVAAESQMRSEKNLILRLDQKKSVDRSGFAGFLNEVLQWRLSSVELLGGAFVKNSLMDYHADLIDSFEKMSFIQLEMLKRSKQKVLSQSLESQERQRGQRVPERLDYQYRWGFNGEFWDDELGDYVFGLESECQN